MKQTNERSLYAWLVYICVHTVHTYFCKMFAWLRSDTYVGLKSSRVRVPACKNEISDTLFIYSALLRELIFASMNYKLAVDSIFTYIHIFGVICLSCECERYVIHTRSARHAFTSMLLLTIPKYINKQQTNHRIEEMFGFLLLHTLWMKLTRNRKATKKGIPEPW